MKLLIQKNMDQQSLKSNMKENKNVLSYEFTASWSNKLKYSFEIIPLPRKYSVISYLNNDGNKAFQTGFP
jgi:hypothetical protein